jgi:predicted nucleic acid-binding protein
VRWAVLDTSVYIGHWERGSYQRELDEVRNGFIVRHSAVVFSELRRGARTRAARHLVDGLFRLARQTWEPTATDWWNAGSLIRRVGDAKHWDRGKRRDFQNDALIGLTARRHGATVVTADRADFEILSRVLRIAILYV